MRMEYGVSLRQATENTKASMQGLLQQCFDNVTENTFQIKCRAKVYTLHYSASSMDAAESPIAALTISMREEKKYHRVEVLEWANKQLLRNYDRSRYTVFILYDDVSAYYSGRVYPMMIEWERQIRNMTLYMLQAIVGRLWGHTELPEKAREAIQRGWIDIRRKKNSERMYEQAMQDIDIRLLENFLLEQDVDSAQLRQCEWALKSMNLPDAVGEAMREAASSSIWKRFYEPDCDETVLHNQVMYIQMLRERIYHGQTFTKSSYERCMTVLEEMIGRMDKAKDRLVETLDSMEKIQYALECLCKRVPKEELELTERLYTLLSITAELTGFACPVLAEGLSQDALLSMIEGQLPAHYQIRLEDMEDE